MSKLTISKIANPNYLAKVFQLTKLDSVPNADRLLVTEVDFQPVLTNKDAVLNDWYVYFPTESKILDNLLKHTNSYRDSVLNHDPLASGGYFEKNGRVKTVKMRGSYSSGFILPLTKLESFIGNDIEKKEVYFDTVNDLVIVSKYIKPFEKKDQVAGLSKSDKKASKISVIPGQFQFHNDTENLRRNSYKIKPETMIDVTYKYHGTSAIVGNVLYKKKPNWWQKVLKITPKPYYDYIWSSRKVIKTKSSVPGYYSQDIWTILKEEIKEKIPKGFVVYGEIVGYLPDGGSIQGKYDYGLKPGTHAFYIYRITSVNEDGYAVELSTDDIIEFSKKVGLPYINKFYSGSAEDLFLRLVESNDTIDKEQFKDDLISYKHYKVISESCSDKDKEKNLALYDKYLSFFQENFVKLLELNYNEKNCYICKNKVPEEGIVIRLSGKLDKFEALKLKSFKFLEKESKDADKEISNIEDEN